MPVGYRLHLVAHRVESGTSTSAKAKGPLSIKGFSLLPFQARTPVRARASGSPFI